MFYRCRGFYVYNNCVFCTRSHVRERHLSDFLSHKFTFSENYFPGDFVHDVYLDKISLFLHYHGIIYASGDKKFENNYGNFGVLHYEEVDLPFLLYKFYLEILFRLIFNNFLEKIMPIMLNDFDLKDYLRYKMITSQNVLFESQVKSVFVS